MSAKGFVAAQHEGSHEGKPAFLKLPGWDYSDSRISRLAHCRETSSADLQKSLEWLLGGKQVVAKKKYLRVFFLAAKKKQCF